MKRSLIEQRLRRELRELSFDPERDAFLVRTGTVEQRVARELLKDVFGARAKVTLVLPSTTKRRDVYLPTSLENELTRGLRCFLEDKTHTAGRRGRFALLMATIPEEEILAYAARHKLKGKTLARRDDVRGLLEALQAGQPQTKAALRRSFGHLRAASEKEPQRL